MILSTGAFTAIRTTLNNLDFTAKMSRTSLSLKYFSLHRFQIGARQVRLKLRI